MVAKAPPRFSQPRTRATTRGWSSRWNASAQVTRSKCAAGASNASTRPTDQRMWLSPALAAAVWAAAIISGSASTAQTSAKRGAMASVKRPGPQARSSSRAPAGNAARASNSSSSAGG
jgi:hypothetical protein